MQSYADNYINKLWEDMKEKDPIFIMHSDHGEGFGEHGFYGHKSCLYEEVVHVPLVIYNAGLKGKKEIARNFQRKGVKGKL